MWRSDPVCSAGRCGGRIRCARRGGVAVRSGALDAGAPACARHGCKAGSIRRHAGPTTLGSLVMLGLPSAPFYCGMLALFSDTVGGATFRHQNN
eukprot:21014-Chlamydomonas_euryale.AAC.1